MGHYGDGLPAYEPLRAQVVYRSDAILRDVHCVYFFCVNDTVLYLVHHFLWLRNSA